MTLFIQTDAGISGGSGDDIFPGNASLDLIQISNNDMGDGTHTGYGEGDPVGNLIQVLYDRSTSGPCPERLDELVNTNFGVNPENIDIIILAVGSGFVLGDGTPMAGNGTARDPGGTDNPTSSILVFYDVEDNFGDGICLNAQDRDEDEYDLSNPTPVLLYHELSHALHFALNDLLSLVTDDQCGNAAPEEQRAAEDENDMRTQMGERLRRTSNHCSETGVDGSCSTSCCVVATVVSGSPYAAPVSSLRQLRDTFLRRSEVGFDFFSRLHDDYYGFSPEVCRQMAMAPGIVEKVRSYFVAPLTLCLNLMRAYTLGRAEPFALGQQLLQATAQSEALSQLAANDRALALAVLDQGLRTGPESDLGALGPLAELLDARAWPSSFVRWALLDPIRMLVTASSWIEEGATAETLGARLARAFDVWGGEMPLTDVWHRLSRYALGAELRFLAQALLRSPEARTRFQERLSSHLGERTDLTSLVSESWGTTAEADT